MGIEAIIGLLALVVSLFIGVWQIHLARKQIGSSHSRHGLASDLGINYRCLNKLLGAGDWELADVETYVCIKKIFNRGSTKGFPSNDLRTIDTLWRKYSGDRFGFSIQREIFLDAGGTQRDFSKCDVSTWNKFCEYVGWLGGNGYIKWEDAKHYIPAPRGHLPLAGVMATSYDAYDGEYFHLSIYDGKNVYLVIEPSFFGKWRGALYLLSHDFK